MISLGVSATKRAILSGTPMPHEWDDLWTQITFLWPFNEPLGTRRQFQRKIRNLTEAGSHITAEQFIGLQKMLTKVLTKTSVGTKTSKEELYAFINYYMENDYNKLNGRLVHIRDDKLAIEKNINQNYLKLRRIE